MTTKSPPKDDGDYRDQIERHYKKAIECLEILRPEDIHEKLGDYAGAKLAILELRRIALGEPKIYAKLKQ